MGGPALFLLCRRIGICYGRSVKAKIFYFSYIVTLSHYFSSYYFCLRRKCARLNQFPGLGVEPSHLANNRSHSQLQQLTPKTNQALRRRKAKNKNDNLSPNGKGILGYMRIQLWHQSTATWQRSQIKSPNFRAMKVAGCWENFESLRHQLRQLIKG